MKDEGQKSSSLQNPMCYCLLHPKHLGALVQPRECRVQEEVITRLPRSAAFIF